jgi:cell pole-organizing protein PopZ
MTSVSFSVRRVVASVAASITLLAGFAVPAWSHTDPHGQMQQDWAPHRQQWVKAQLARMAERLEIKASQQGAWEAYAKVIGEAANVSIKMPDENADAAAIARAHADFAAQNAKRLSQIADATARLEEALTPDQRKTLDQIVHEFHHHMMHHRFHGEHREGERRHDDDER